MGGKHFSKIDSVFEEQFGLELVRANNRSMALSYNIIDQERYDHFFTGKKIKLIRIRSKDMGLFLDKKQVSYVYNYSVMMDNYPSVWNELCRTPIPQIRLTLLKKKQKEVDPHKWRP